MLRLIFIDCSLTTALIHDRKQVKYRALPLHLYLHETAEATAKTELALDQTCTVEIKHRCARLNLSVTTPTLES